MKLSTRIRTSLSYFALAGLLFAPACRSDDAARDLGGTDSAVRPAHKDTAAVTENADTGSRADTVPGSIAAGTEKSPEHTLKQIEAMLLSRPGMGEVSVTWREAGVIELRGTVQTAQERTEAESAVREIKDVRDVVNSITVRR